MSSSSSREVQILAIDQGTTGTTCLVLSNELELLGRHTCDFPQHFPKPGWVEHDPEELWNSVLTAIAEVLKQPGVDAKKIAAIGVTNQRETSLIWRKKDGQAIHRALVWQDRRTADRCAALREAGHEAAIQEKTGLLLDPYFSGTKLAWILDEVPGAREAAQNGELAAGTIDTYLVHRLTNGQVHATDPSNACRTLLRRLDAHLDDRPDWDPELCELFGVPPQILPEVRPSTANFGSTQDVPGLPDGIPIHGIAGDQQAGLFGQACTQEGEAKCTYGTGAFAMLNTGSKVVHSKHRLLTSVAWQIGNDTTFCLEGSSFMAGAVVSWLRDGLGIIKKPNEIEALAREVSDSDGVVFVPAHTGLGAPHWRPEARGLIHGLTRASNKSHIAWAALEGIALSCDDLLTAMKADAGNLSELRVDGGAAANNLLMQLQSDLLGLPLSRPSMLESTALGATFMAGLGVGIWTNFDELRNARVEEKRFQPQGDAAQLEQMRTYWRRAVDMA